MASPFLKRVQRTFTRFNVFVYRLSGGKILGKMIGPPLLLLTTTGRKTGKPRTTPIGFLHENGEYLIAATASGSDQNPTWLANLQSNPEATIEVKGKQIAVKAVITSGAERDQLYKRFEANSSSFTWVQSRTTRTIPVIRLLPIST